MTCEIIVNRWDAFSGQIEYLLTRLFSTWRIMLKILCEFYTSFNIPWISITCYNLMILNFTFEQSKNKYSVKIIETYKLEST